MTTNFNAPIKSDFVSLLSPGQPRAACAYASFIAVITVSVQDLKNDIIEEPAEDNDDKENAKIKQSR